MLFSISPFSRSGSQPASADYLPPADESCDDEDEEEIEEAVPLHERPIPEAGPWHSVAKNLHEVLQQMNVLIDNLAVMRHTDYVKPLTILDPLQNMEQNKMNEAIASSKCGQWIWRRRALAEAADVLDKAHARFSTLIDSDGMSAKGQFFSELKKMREYWRVRKAGEYIFGGLGYHIFGSKYNAKELFDISRRSKPVYFRKKDFSYAAGEVDFSQSFSSVLQVTVPHDLMRRSTLSVSIVKDDETTKNIYASLDDAHFEYMKIDEKRLETINWQHALKWAQERLIYRDTFNTLCTEAPVRYILINEGNFVADGVSYLNRSLRQLIVARECTRWVRPQIHVALPLSNLSEALDIRGAKALTDREIDERAFKPQYVLEKIIDVANHYSLVCAVIETLKDISLSDPDPLLQWRFLRSTPTFSHIMLILSNKHHEHVQTKSIHYVNITSSGVSVSGREGTAHECYRDRRLLTYTIKGLICSLSVNTGDSLGKTWWWMQVLHANMNAVDEDGETCPTLFLCNHSSSRLISLLLAWEKISDLLFYEFSEKAFIATTHSSCFPLRDELLVCLKNGLCHHIAWGGAIHSDMVRLFQHSKWNVIYVSRVVPNFPRNTARKRAISDGSVSSSLARESSTSNSQNRETFLLTGTPSTSNADCTTETTKDSENADDISDEFRILDKDDNPFELGLTTILAFVLMGEKKFAAVVFKEDHTPYLIDNDVAKEYILDLLLAATLTTYNMIPREDVQANERKSEGQTESQEEDVNMEPV